MKTISNTGITLLLVMVSLLGSASTLRAATATVTATWNQDPESDIAGYVLSYGVQSGVYTTTVNVGNVTTWQLTLTAGQTYYFAVQAYDTSGLTSPYSAEVSFTVPSPPGAPPAPPAAPTITSLASTSGPVGRLVTVTGTNFGSTQGASTVAFNGTTGTPTTWSATSIVVTVPAGATTGSVVVTVGGVASNGVTFTVTPTPSVTNLTPTNGPVGTAVTIAGANFGATEGTSSVTFNGTTATPTAWSATGISAPVPAGATTGTVVVTVGGVASTGVGFTVTTNTTTGPEMTTPAPGSTLTASTVTFQWTGGTGVTDYQLSVGTTLGGSNLLYQDFGTQLSATVSGLPTNGSTLYVRLWWLINGAWHDSDYTYTATSTTGSAAAQLTTPPPGSTLTASTVTFQWTGGTGVTEYRLSVGTTAGGTDLFDQVLGTNLSATVTGLPTSGSTLFVRLWSMISGAWQFNDYTYTATTTASTAAAQLTTPPPGSTLTASTVTFQWTGGTGVTEYRLSVGTTAGGTDLFDQVLGTNLSATVTGLPTNGSTLFVRLWSMISGAWQFHDYTYTAATTASGTPQLTTPPPSSTLTASTVTFQWTGGTGVTDYQLSVGTTLGGGNLLYQDFGTQLSATMAGLPTNGSTVFVRLWWLVNGAWQDNDYTYTATSTASAAAQLTTPAPGSTLTASTVTFQWTGGTGATEYRLSVGTTAGGTNLFDQVLGTNLSATVTGLPTNSSAVFVRLWSLVNGTWQFNDYTFTATTTTSASAELTTPPPGSTLAATTVTFQWTGGAGVTDYQLSVGTTLGGGDLLYQDEGMNLSATVTGLPGNGSTLYVRLWSLVNGSWQYSDYTYAAS